MKAQLEKQGYLRIFRDRWLAIVVGLLLGVWIAGSVGASIRPTYTSTATLFLSVQSDGGSLLERSTFALARISSYPELAFSSDVLGATISDLNLNMSVQELSDSITATNPATTVLLQIGARAPSARQSAEIANSVANNLAAVVSKLENSPDDSRYSVNLDLRIPAQAPTSPSAPQIPVILGLGLVAGLAAGLIGAIGWARLDTSIRTIGQVRRVSGLPVLGELPVLRNRFGPLGAFMTSGKEAMFRETQLSIRQANAAVMPDFLVLVPASRAAGGVDVRVGFARNFAATGRSVGLVESDFRGGIESLVPSVNGSKGLAEVLSGLTSVKRVLEPVDGERFKILPAGDPELLPEEYVAEQHIRETVKELVDTFDITLIQATSVTQPASLQLVGPYADCVVVVVRYGRTRTADLARVLSRLRLTGVRALGVVMIGVPPLRRSDLAASWLPGDFSDVKRTSILSLEADPSAVTPVRAVKAAEVDMAPEEAPAVSPAMATTPAARSKPSRRRGAPAKTASQAAARVANADSDLSIDESAPETGVGDEVDSPTELPDLPEPSTDPVDLVDAVTAPIDIVTPGDRGDRQTSSAD
jgi:capsular polysaccharide biosynthesis protein